MRHFQNSVLDFHLGLSERYASPPLEVAWASEAIFFVRIHSSGGAKLRFNANAQISVDGVDWIDSGDEFAPIEQPGQYALRLKHFGGWLRLVGNFEGDAAGTSITTNLVLKE